MKEIRRENVGGEWTNELTNIWRNEWVGNVIRLCFLYLVVIIWYKLIFILMFNRLIIVICIIF